ncbi:MAG: hypothetical protein U5N10_01245 [Gemmobacter sp.]|nr:hypothetical protein [Gemmobacter sp.]
MGRGGKSRAPVCVAKGMDEIAARIRERRMTGRGADSQRPANGARAATRPVEIWGRTIRPEHYARRRRSHPLRRDAMRRKRRGHADERTKTRLDRAGAIMAA